jgi:calcium-dependent protein kinase
MALSNLKTFKYTTKLQQATWVYLVTFMTTKSEQKQLMQVFKNLDTNHDGQLSREELVSGYCNQMSRPEAEAEVERIFRVVD